MKLLRNFKIRRKTIWKNYFDFNISHTHSAQNQQHLCAHLPQFDLQTKSTFECWGYAFYKHTADRSNQITLKHVKYLWIKPKNVFVPFSLVTWGLNFVSLINTRVFSECVRVWERVCVCPPRVAPCFSDSQKKKRSFDFPKWTVSVSACA